MTRYHSCRLPRPRSSSAIGLITAVCSALALTMLATTLGILLSGSCPALAPAPAGWAAARLALTLAAGFTRPIAARTSFDTMPSIMARSEGISLCMSSVGKSSNALTKGTRCAFDSEASGAASWASVTSILVGFEVGQTLDGARWQAVAGVRAPGGGAGVSCGSARACPMSLVCGLTRGGKPCVT